MHARKSARARWRRAGFPVALALAFAFIGSNISLADDPPPTEEDLQRQKAIAEFTAKMKEANYPALFEKAAKEFGVPADVLKGIAFAETRWEHLTWPPGETVSPENGMPHPYGIMSLWDNEYFGHSLLEAAKLIGKQPEDLKRDPLDNIRGAAALLKKIYLDNPKPKDAAEQDIESWRYAIVKYCGIPEADLSHRHGLEVYEFMNEGFHQFGIEWEARPVNLGPMRDEVKQIVAAEERKMQERMKEDPRLQDGIQLASYTPNSTAARNIPTVVSPKTDGTLPTISTTLPVAQERPGIMQAILIWGTLAIILVAAIAVLRNRRSKASK
jgi:hypothetical protein